MSDKLREAEATDMRLEFWQTNPPTISIAPNGKELLALLPDGTVRCDDLLLAQEAGRVFVESVRSHWVPLVSRHLSETSPSAEVEDSRLIAQLTGRAQFLRDRGEVKSPQLLEEAATVLAALTAKTSPDAGDGWLPIASAPKDGSKFDAWVPDAFGGRRMTGLSFNRRGELRQHGLLTKAELPRWPTHWRPLPAPPSFNGERDDG